MRRVLVILSVAGLACTAFATVGAGPAAAAPGAIVQLAGLDSGIECPLARIDLASGQVSEVSSDMGICSADLALGPDGTLYGVDGRNRELLTYDTDPASAGYGTSTVVGPLGTEGRSTASGLTFDASGALWMVTSGLGPFSTETPPDAQAEPCLFFSCLYQVDPASGAASLVAEVSTDVPDDTVFVGSLAGACTGQVYLEYATTLLQPGTLDAATSTTTTTTDDASGTADTPDEVHGLPVAFDGFNLGILGTSDGRVAGIGPDGDQVQVEHIDFSADQVLYGIDDFIVTTSSGGAGAQAPPPQSVYTVNRGTGAATAVAGVTDLPENSFILSLAVAPVRPCVEELPITFTG